MIARIGQRIAGIGGRASAGRFSHKPRHPESNPERQQRELERLREEVKERDERIAELQKQIGEKEKQIADLERQLALRKQNSTNSSKPPSSDGLAGEQRLRGRGKKRRRKPGGQPGHQGAHRSLVPAERINQVCPILPEQCQGCGEALPTELEQAQTVGTPNQMIGSVTMGIGMGMLEEAVYDGRNGHPINNNFADYRVAVNADVPDIECIFLDYPDTVMNEYGARGIGEIGCAPALTSATYHATGVRVRELPIRIEKLIAQAEQKT